MASKIQVCVDCIMFIANHQLPEDGVRALHVYFGCDEWYEQGFTLEAGNEESSAFSSAACDCCESGLGGSRHEAWAIPIR